MDSLLEGAMVCLAISVIINIVQAFLNHKTHMKIHRLNDVCDRLHSNNRKLDDKLKRIAQDKSEFKRHE